MKTNAALLLTVLMLSGFSIVQAQNLLPKLQKLFGAANVIAVDSSAYKEYYKINVPTPIDHTGKHKGKYLNRILLGFNDFASPVVMESGPYGFYGYQEKASYKTELTQLLDANQIIVEHRYFGTSIPDSATFKYLTYKQVSDDFHHIRQKLNSIFPSKWIATGHSKGGDAVLAYKFYYPNDVAATVTYGISLTMEAEDKRFDQFIAQKRKSEDGKKVYEDQIYLLKNKKRLLTEFISFTQNEDVFMGVERNEFDAETIYDFGVLGIDIEFWKSYGDYEKFKAGTESLYEQLLAIGYQPTRLPKNFQDKLIYLFDVPLKMMNAHYYQAFSEGGYYGFDEKPFQKYLKNKKYSLSVFAGEKTVFDNTFRLAERKWTETEMEHLMLIIADTDPWAAVCPIPFPPNKDNVRLVLKNSTHSAKLKDFDEETRNFAVQKLKSWLEKK